MSNWMDINLKEMANKLVKTVFFKYFLCTLFIIELYGFTLLQNVVKLLVSVPTLIHSHDCSRGLFSF